MKKVLLFTFFMLGLYLNAECVIAYYCDDAEYSGGYDPSYTQPATTVINPVTTMTFTSFTPDITVMTEINTRKSEIRQEMSRLRELLAYETDPYLRAYYQSELARLETEMASVQQMTQADLSTVINNQSYILNLLSSIMRMLQDMAQSIIRSLSW